MEFTKGTLKGINEKVVKAVEDALKDTGVKVRFSGGSYSELEYKLKLTLTTETEDGMTSSEKDFIEYAPFYGLDPDMLGKTVKYAGKMYKVTGFYPNRRKNNISIENVKTGKTYIAPHTEVIKAYNGVAGAGITLG